MTHTIKSLVGGTALAAIWFAAVLVGDVILHVYLEVPLR